MMCRREEWMERISLLLMKDELKGVMKRKMGMIGRKEAKISLKNRADRLKISHAVLVSYFEDLMNLVKAEIHEEELDKL